MTTRWMVRIGKPTRGSVPRDFSLIGVIDGRLFGGCHLGVQLVATPHKAQADQPLQSAPARVQERLSLGTLVSSHGPAQPVMTDLSSVLALPLGPTSLSISMSRHFYERRLHFQDTLTKEAVIFTFSDRLRKYCPPIAIRVT
jgi:hypothetical protein